MSGGMALACLVSISSAAGQSAHRGDALPGTRIEHETKLKVPMEQTEQIWTWLQKRYADCSWLEHDDVRYEVSFGDEDFTDTYFDTPDLHMLADQSGVRHRVRVVHSGSAARKDGRELLQIKLNRGDATGLARSEVKFKVAPDRWRKAFDDGHPMLGLLDRDERSECKTAFAALGVDPYAMRPMFTLLQNRRRVYLSDQKGAFATLTLDLCSTKSWGTDLRWAEIELELNEVRYTEADETERQRMEAVMSAVQRDLQASHPSLVQDQTPKYNTAFARIESATWLPLRRLIGWEINADQVAGILLITALIAVGTILCGVAWCWRRWQSRPGAMPQACPA